MQGPLFGKKKEQRLDRGDNWDNINGRLGTFQKKKKKSRGTKEKSFDHLKGGSHTTEKKSLDRLRKERKSHEGGEQEPS